MALTLRWSGFEAQLAQLGVLGAEAAPEVVDRNDHEEDPGLLARRLDGPGEVELQILGSGSALDSTEKAGLIDLG